MTFAEFYESFETKSDKGTTHDYINGYYSNEFTSIRNNKLKILEIGVHRGPSMKLLRDWFINSEIIGIDPFYDLPKTMADAIRKMGDIKIIEAHAYTQDVLNMFEANSIDYLIDDGPHTIDSQIYSVKNWFNKVKSGGKLIIEDIQSNSDLNKLIDEVHNLNYAYKVFDLTKNKNRYDDIILEIVKK